MREFLLALILTAAGLPTSKSSDQHEKDSDVKYKGPVVYTNLPPPVLYFPNFPEKPKFSNRASAGDAEDKRIEYVPFPYKDLPLLVYQSQSQPPVHVVEESPNQNQHPGKDVSSQPQHSSGYQTGPALYRVAESQQYGNEEAGSTLHQAIIASPSERLINVGLATSPLSGIDTPNQQYISIAIQPQGNDLQVQPSSSHPQQTNNVYNDMQYSVNHNADDLDYSSENVDPIGQSGSAYVYYSDQYSNQNADAQAQVPVEQITQAIQNYLMQQGGIQQQAQSGVHQTQVAYAGKPDPYASPAENVPAQHLGITIIRQPPVSDDDSNGNQYDAPPPSIVHQPPRSNDQGYDDNQQQYVSIGVYPVNVPGNDYAEDPQQYYNLVAPAPNDQYQNGNEDYRQSNQNYESPAPPPAQNGNTQTTGYQLISIDLSALKKQNAEQQRNPAPEYPQQRPTHKPLPPPPPPPPPPPQTYRPANENDNSHNNREKKFQQIFIQIPHNILSDQSNKAPPRGRGPYETPYTGTAQVANVMRDQNKLSNAPTVTTIPIYNRPLPPQRPPPNIQYAERPRNPKETFGFPQKGVISNGINIAIINKQTEPTGNPPVFKNPEQRPPYSPTHVRAPAQPVVNRIPPPPNVSHPPRRPVFGFPNQQSPPKNVRYNRGRDAPNFRGQQHYPNPPNRYPVPRNFGEFRSKPLVPQLGGHPGIYSSSNHHYNAVNPTVRRPPFYGTAFRVHQPGAFGQASATKNHAQFVPSPVPSNAVGTENVEQAFTNNISNGFGEINFDEINAFLNPNYDLFGPMAGGPDKKKVEEEAKFLQKVTGDLLSHDFNAASLVPPIPPFGIVKPPPNVMNAPFPYKFWEQPVVPNIAPPGFVHGSDRTKLMNYYTHMQHPYAGGNRPFSPFGKGKGRKRGLGKGKLRRKLAALRTSIRHKSKIAPRQETTDETGESVSEQLAESSIYEIAAPRSTIIKRDGPGLDGITIPLNPEHVLSSRISTFDDETEENAPLPPIIVYKGSMPPIEIYGSKSDIEEASGDNKTQKLGNDKKEESSRNVPPEQPDELHAEESLQIYSSQGDDYIDYMYSMLPDLIRDSFHRRLDGSSDKWLPVSPIEYALAEDAYDRNETTVEKAHSPIQLETLKDVPQNSSTKIQASVEENIGELFSLKGAEETSDLVKE